MVIVILRDPTQNELSSVAWTFGAWVRFDRNVKRSKRA
jgi:hypothetical protein